MPAPRKQISLRAIRQWGICDFRRKASYPSSYEAILEKFYPGQIFPSSSDTDRHIRWAWRWEFLRRTMTYRRYWLFCSPNDDHYHPDFYIRGTLPSPKLTVNLIDRHDLYEHLWGGVPFKQIYVNIEQPLLGQLDILARDLKAIQSRHIEVQKKIHGRDLSHLNDVIRAEPNHSNFPKFLRALDAREINSSYELLDEHVNNQSGSGRSAQGLKTFQQAKKMQQRLTGLADLEWASYSPTVLKGY